MSQSDSPAVRAIRDKLAYLEDNLHRWKWRGRGYPGQPAEIESHERQIAELKTDAERLGVKL